jgi:hypothetical protein
MKTLLLLIFTSFALILHAQDANKIGIEILKSKLTPGIYKTFNEFSKNKPSLNLDFYLEERTYSQIWAWGGTEYAINFTDKNISKKFIKDSIWGVCKNDTIYVNNRLISVNKGFDRLMKLDYPLSYFVGYVIMKDEDKESARVMGSFGAIGGATAGTPHERIIAINMKTGELIRLNDYGMQKILADDSELLDKYNKIKEEAEDASFIFPILDEYNSKH